MFYKECGTALPENSKFCPNCDTSVFDATAALNEMQVEQEIIIMKGLYNRIKSPFWVQNGNAILTNKRFIHLKHSLAKMVEIGLLVNLTAGSS